MNILYFNNNNIITTDVQYCSKVNVFGLINHISIFEKKVMLVEVYDVAPTTLAKMDLLFFFLLFLFWAKIQ